VLGVALAVFFAVPLGEWLWWVRAPLIVASLAFAFEAAGGARVRLEIAEDGVRVRNGWRETRVDYERFDRFVLRRSWLGQKSGWVETTDGRAIPCAVLSPTGVIGGGSEFAPVIDDLNRLAAEVAQRS
jgi:hypothetical protein